MAKVSMDLKIYTDTITIQDETVSVDTTLPLDIDMKNVIQRTFQGSASKIISEAVESTS